MEYSIDSSVSVKLGGKSRLSGVVCRRRKKKTGPVKCYHRQIFVHTARTPFSLLLNGLSEMTTDASTSNRKERVGNARVAWLYDGSPRCAK